MKRLILLFIFLSASLQISAREVVNINRDWRFFCNSDASSDGAMVVNLPHTWNQDVLSGSRDYFRGIGNYRKEIRIPAEWRNKRIFIKIGAAATTADLIVNGKHVGEHKGGYTAFTFELTEYLRYGEPNMFWIIVNNAPRMDVLPTAGDINIYGGLYRDVELIVTEKNMISLDGVAADGVYVTTRSLTPQRAEATAAIHIDGTADSELIVALAVTNPRQDTIAFQASRFRVPIGGKGTLDIPIVLERPRYWDGVENPYLYGVTVKVYENETLCDSVTVPMGLRTIQVDAERGFILNGHLYDIKGVVYYEDRALVGPAITSYQLQEDLDLMVELGINAIRAAAYPHHPEFYEECDKRGILVWTDLPFLGPVYLTDRGYVNTTAFRENGTDQLKEMIAQLYNHPSIAMWGLFSDQSLRGDDPTTYIRVLHNLAKQRDPSRLTIGASNQDGNMNFVTDLIGWDHILGWREGQPEDIKLWLDQLGDKWSHLKSALLYGAGGCIYHQEDSLQRPEYLSTWHPERWQTHLHEIYYSYVDSSQLWGIFVANMFDYGAAGNVWGEGLGIDDRGLITFDRKYRKDAFYFYKANWNRSEPFVYIAEKRWDRRTSRTQTLKVFSNEAEVELLVNGMSLGAKTGKNGTFVWEGIELKDGQNHIQARGRMTIDYATVEIVHDRLNHRIN